MYYNCAVGKTRPWRRWSLRARKQTRERLDSARDRWPAVDRVAIAFERYRTGTAHYDALVVLYRAIFLAVCVMLSLLYALELVTNVLPGANEVTIPFVELPAEQDLGATVQATVSHSRGAVLGIVGVATLLSSAMSTAKAPVGMTSMGRTTWEPSRMMAPSP